MILLPRLPLTRGKPSLHAEPRTTQLAALCWRKAKGETDGKVGPRREILLVSSSSGRWILPKGWPMAGRSEGDVALREAWEEGGVARGKVERRPVGEYMAIKRTAQGDDVPCLHRVFAIKVRETAEAFPEAHRRDRLWLPPKEAAALVDEDGLRDILSRFAQA